MTGNPEVKTGMELRITGAPGTRNSSLFARFVYSTCDQGALPQSLCFSSSRFFCPSFCFRLNALPVSPISLACFLSCFRDFFLHLQGKTWRLPPLPQTLPPEALALLFLNTPGSLSTLSFPTSNSHRTPGVCIVSYDLHITYPAHIVLTV